jgi:glycosyltransferase involved in cell wall biosynthesis
VALAARLPVIFHLHGGGFETFYEQSGQIRRYFIRLILRKVHTLIALSEAARHWLSCTTGRGDVLILPNPVSIPYGEHREASPPYILFMGKLSKEKGIFDLLEAYAKTREMHRSSRLVCAGEGDIEAVQARCMQLGISEAVELPGWVEGEEKAALLAGAAVFVLPSYYEAMPMSLLEAMAWGVPVVASEVGAISEILSCETGVCIQPGNTTALADALEYLITNPGIRSNMGQFAKQSMLIKHFPDSVISHLGRIYIAIGATASQGV